MFVLCLIFLLDDNSRVILNTSGEGQDTDDYINASYIKVSNYSLLKCFDKKCLFIAAYNLFLKYKKGIKISFCHTFKIDITKTFGEVFPDNLDY